MPGARRVRTTNVASVALALVAGLLVAGVPDVSLGYVTMLWLAGAAGAALAAIEVSNDDLLGWSSAVGAAVAVASLLVAAHTTGLPGYRPGSIGAGVALGLLACTSIGIAAFVRFRTVRRRAPGSA